MTIMELKAGETGIIKQINGTTHLKQRLIRFGIIPNNFIKMVKPSPMKDPYQFIINDNISITLRKRDANHILIEKKNYE